MPSRILVLLLLLGSVSASVKYNQRLFVQVRAISFVDPTKHGFRVILDDDFLKNHLAPTLLPTLYVSAIPLKASDSTVSRVIYPDTVNEEKQVALSDLRERSWYFVCIEWENFNRHNETTGADCRVFRTLDRFGKSADSVVSDLEVTDITSQLMTFRLRAHADFPVRVTASLQGGQAPLPASQTFVFKESSDLDVIFPFLRQDTDYGRLCLMEEPLVNGYTAMGRLVSGLRIQKCYFNDLKTKDYDIHTVVEASAFKSANSATFAAIPLLALIAFAVAGR